MEPNGVHGFLSPNGDRLGHVAKKSKNQDICSKLLFFPFHMPVFLNILFDVKKETKSGIFRPSYSDIVLVKCYIIDAYKVYKRKSQYCPQKQRRGRV
jgi:hypothetical protein